MQNEQDGEDGDESHRGLKPGRYLLGQGVLNDRQVRSHARKEFADAPAVVEVDRQADEMAEQPAPQVAQQARARGAKKPRLEVRQHGKDREQADQGRDDPAQPALQVRLDGRVHEVAGLHGHEHEDARAQEQQDGAKDERPRVRPPQAVEPAERDRRRSAFAGGARARSHPIGSGAALRGSRERSPPAPALKLTCRPSA